MDKMSKVKKTICDIAPLVLIGWATSKRLLPVGYQIAAVIGLYVFGKVAMWGIMDAIG